jgi:PA domain/LVIVD repeat
MTRWLFALVTAVALLAFSGTGAAQHDPASADHLLTPITPGGQPQRADGTWGDVQLVGTVRLHDAENDLNADLTVDYSGKYAFEARWGGSKCAGPEAGGRGNPDGGSYVIDISNLSAPQEVGFIATHQDTLVGEGQQYVELTTSKFTGPVLFMNHEQCGKNGRGGWSLWDVKDPLNAKKLSETTGDFDLDSDNNTPHKANQTHSGFVWNVSATKRAFLVSVDDDEMTDVDIYEVTDPKKPVKLTELALNDGTWDNDPPLDQPDLDLTQTFFHDVVVKKIDGQWLMLLSYWDGGWVILNVENPADPQFVGDYDYQSIDPELLAQTGVALSPEGNAHEAEFSPDNRFILGTDEDFGPSRGQMESNGTTVRVGVGSPAEQLDPGDTLTGPTRFVGRACNGDPAPSAPIGTDEIAIVERGVCTFSEKLANIEAIGGYVAVVIMNREGNDANNTPCTGIFDPFVEASIPVFFASRDDALALFGVPYVDADCRDGNLLLAPIALGTVGDDVTLSTVFDGWGYVHLLDRASLTDLDTYAIPEAMDPDFIDGFGALSVHEATFDPNDSTRGYLSYYAGGLRALKINCPNPPPSTVGCTLAEVGGFIDPDTDGAGPDPGGNEYWGIETRIINGRTYIFASDMDGSLWIFTTRS